MQGFRAVMRRVTDPAKRSRLLFGAVGWFIASVLTVFGVGFLFGGVGASSVPGAYAVFTRFVPGNLHTYGAVLTALGLALIHGLVPPVHGMPVYYRWLHRVLLIVGGFCFLLAWLFAWSWALSGVKTWQSITLWTAASGLSFVAAWWAAKEEAAPDDRRGRGA